CILLSISRASSLLTTTPTIEIYPLSLHDALPISETRRDNARRASRETAARSECDLPSRDTCPPSAGAHAAPPSVPAQRTRRKSADRKSTRLNSSHQINSYAVFCLKKKNNIPCTHH